MELQSWVDNNGFKINSNKTQGMFLGRRGRRNEVKHALLAQQGMTLTAEPKVKFHRPFRTIEKCKL